MAQREQGSVDEPDVREVVRLADPLGEGVRERAGQEGKLYIASVGVAAEFVMPPLLKLFHSDHPDVRLSMIVGNRASTLQRVLYGEADLAIGGRPPASVGIRGEPFLENHFVLAAGPTHPLAAAELVERDALSGETWIVREAGSGSRRAAEAFWGRNDIEPRAIVTLGSNGSVRQAVALGMGVTLISAYAVAADLEEGKLASLPVAGTPEGSWYALYLGRGRLVPAALAFLDLLRSSQARAAIGEWFGNASHLLRVRRPLPGVPA